MTAATSTPSRAHPAQVLLDAQGGDLRAYYAQVRALARGPAAARRALCGP